MLSCKDVAQRASALIDDELSLWETLQMRLHLAMCKGCSSFIHQLRTTDHVVAKIANPADGQSDNIDSVKFAEVLSELTKEKH